MHQRERRGGEIAWEELCWEGVTLKMRSCWHGFYTEQLLHTGALHRGALHGGSFTHREACTQGGLYTESLLHVHRKAFTHKLLHREVFIQSSLDTEKLAHTEAFTQRNLLQRAAFTQGSFYTEKLVHAEALTQRSEKSLHRGAFTQRS